MDEVAGERCHPGRGVDLVRFYGPVLRTLIISIWRPYQSLDCSPGWLVYLLKEVQETT